jgi:23S rRNA-/tRNA-specific pseudouridylate synthase
MMSSTNRNRLLEILALYAVITRGVVFGFTLFPSPRTMLLVSSNNAMLTQRNNENTKQLINEIDREFNDSVNAIDSNSRPIQTEKKTTKTKQKKNKIQRERIPILSYKSNYVIVSKPAGMTMHRNSNAWGQAKTIPVLESTIHKQLARKPYLVHRLDHRTSGAHLRQHLSCMVGYVRWMPQRCMLR